MGNWEIVWPTLIRPNSVLTYELVDVREIISWHLRFSGKLPIALEEAMEYIPN